MKKAILLANLLILASSAGFAKSGKDSVDCKKQKLLAAQQELLEKMQIEEIEAAISETQAKLDQKKSEVERESEAALLADLLEQVEKYGKVKIENCSELKIKEKTEKAEKILAQIEEYCEASPTGFYAEMKKDGSLLFTFSNGTTGGTRTMQIGGAMNLTLAYRGHEIKMTGNLTKARVGKGSDETGTTKYDASADYSIDLGLSNIESFIKWKHTFESVETPNAVVENRTQTRRNTTDIGLRYSIFDNDTVQMKIGAGAGFNRLYQKGTGIDSTESYRPVVTSSYDFKIKPSDLLELTLNASAQRDISGEKPNSVYGAKASAKVQLGPVATGVSYSADWDSARITASKLNHQLMFTLGASLNPDDWTDDEKLKHKKERLAYEEALWQLALERIRRAKAK